MDFSRFIDFKKISFSDLLDTLGLVLSQPWKMTEAVYKGGNSAQNALIFYLVLFSASLLVFLPFGVDEEFRRFAKHFTTTALLVLAVTSVTFFIGMRIAGVSMPFHKALSIKAFIGGTYVLVLNAVVALAVALLTHFMSDEVPTFSAFSMGCLPIMDLTGDTPTFATPGPTLTVYLGISLFSLALNLYLYVGVFVGLAPFRKRGKGAYIMIVISIFILDYALTAAYAGRNLNVSSAYCTKAQAVPSID